MKIYRIATAAYINDISGTGAKLYGGRWNEKGTPLLYCSEHISLAILEILVHFDKLTAPNNLKLLTLEFPDMEIEKYSIRQFNKIEKLEDAEFQFKNEGMKWVKNNNSFALKVPSVIIREEFNILINPIHSKFGKLKLKKVSDLDSRLFQ